MQRSLSRLGLFVFICGLLTASLAYSADIVAPRAPSAPIVRRDPFALGRTLVNPRSLHGNQWETFLDVAAGKPRHSAFRKFGGDPKRYLQAIGSSRDGKVFEALFAWSENQAFARAGSSQRIITTAAEGSPSHAADLLLGESSKSPSGTSMRIRARIQTKLGWKAAVRALDNPKYSRMQIGTPEDSLQTIRREVYQAESKAARRGLPLTDKWANVRRSLESGRLFERPPSGASLPTRAEIRSLSEEQVRRHFRRFAALDATRFERMVQIAGEAVILLDVVYLSYDVQNDIVRFRRGEIDAVYGSYRSALHLAEGASIAVAWCAIDPTTKLVATGIVIVIQATKLITDAIYTRIFAARREAAERVLELIDRQARYEVVRFQILTMRPSERN